MISRTPLIAVLVMVGCFIPPPRSTAPTGPGPTGDPAAAEPSPAGESAAAPTETKVTIDNSACDQNGDAIVDEAGGGRQNQPLGSHASTEITVEPDHLPATLCLTVDHNDCATNRAKITATTQRVIVSSDCHAVHSE